MMLFDYPLLQTAEEGVLIAGMLGGDAMHPPSGSPFPGLLTSTTRSALSHIIYLLGWSCRNTQNESWNLKKTHRGVPGLITTRIS